MSRFGTPVVVIVAFSSALTVVCGILLWISVWFVVVGTLACAVTALGAFFGAFLGFDERLRRGP